MRPPNIPARETLANVSSEKVRLAIRDKRRALIGAVVNKYKNDPSVVEDIRDIVGHVDTTPDPESVDETARIPDDAIPYFFKIIEAGVAETRKPHREINVRKLRGLAVARQALFLDTMGAVAAQVTSRAEYWNETDLADSLQSSYVVLAHTIADFGVRADNRFREYALQAVKFAAITRSRHDNTNTPEFITLDEMDEPPIDTVDHEAPMRSIDAAVDLTHIFRSSNVSTKGKIALGLTFGISPDVVGVPGVALPNGQWVDYEQLAESMPRNGYSHKEVAEILESTPGSMRVTVHRYRKTLTKEVSEKQGELHDAA